MKHDIQKIWEINDFDVDGRVISFAEGIEFAKNTL